MKKAMLIAVTLGFTINLMAAPIDQSSNAPLYQVDIVVFEYQYSNMKETWPTVKRHNWDEAISLVPTPKENYDTITSNTESEYQEQSIKIDTDNEFFVSLPTTKSSLNDKVEKLRDNHKILLQETWRMPVGPEKTKKLVRLKAVSSESPNLMLDGVVSVSEERFLHVDVNLWLNKLVPEDSYLETATSGLNGMNKMNSVYQMPIKTPLNSEQFHLSNLTPPNLVRLEDGGKRYIVTDNFPLEQRRRIRNSNEIQYFDTPVIGVLLKLTPYKQEPPSVN